ncbi:PTS system mannose/fructose/sorbose family transporter subunit IID [Oceanivirga miroungae]|uniref:PTS system mannose/fructose/sorbose family transporter subunit IID n=1 Tax=Oceanivirga miroungae TaxID=1130046 RepID=A0A6I8MDY7_9FUSO|nr:PTS system mannose/fructose/sorbose family transporter subunit IID [Oceanivirga miroungae]VWL85404.1 PTS system mannose/fructose/sorbose family transporter subunit IID [Oceanivirga miroungae]
MEKKITLSKGERFRVALRHQFLQGSWNYERMQNGGWGYAMIPAIKKLYPNKEDQIKAMQRHLEFYNTHPYVSSPVLGVTLALEEDRANGADIDDVTIQGVKVGMMGPLAGVGDPVFWFTARPILGALAASLALTGSIIGPLLFFIVWNIMRLAFEWYTQEFGYRVGTKITKDLSGGLLGKITEGASILGMFIVGALVKRWVSINFTLTASRPIDTATLNAAGEVVREIKNVEYFNLQHTLDSLIPGLPALLLTLLCCWLLRKKVSPITIIIVLFVVGVVAHVAGIM